jgi:hypothetical protein
MHLLKSSGFWAASISRQFLQTAGTQIHIACSVRCLGCPVKREAIVQENSSWECQPTLSVYAQEGLLWNYVSGEPITFLLINPAW